ncbi:hypothetical protein AAE478_002089 [Parahypoxylon ruwenzoriense]
MLLRRPSFRRRIELALFVNSQEHKGRLCFRTCETNFQSAQLGSGGFATDFDPLALLAAAATSNPTLGRVELPGHIPTTGTSIQWDEVESEYDRGSRDAEKHGWDIRKAATKARSDQLPEFVIGNAKAYVAFQFNPGPMDSPLA